MRRAVWVALCLLAVSQLHAQRCAATPEEAARDAVGARAVGEIAHAAGYRAEGLQLDPAMGRAWIRVRRCGSPSAPALLVPVSLDLQSSPLPPPPATPGQVLTGIRPRPAPSVQAGDPVTVLFASKSVRLEMQGTAGQQAAVGDALEVSLAGAPGEPVHRIRGILRAEHRVEVQP